MSLYERLVAYVFTDNGDEFLDVAKSFNEKKQLSMEMKKHLQETILSWSEKKDLDEANARLQKMDGNLRKVCTKR